jgi:hypothetical protein
VSARTARSTSRSRGSAHAPPQPTGWAIGGGRSERACHGVIIPVGLPSARAKTGDDPTGPDGDSLPLPPGASKETPRFRGKFPCPSGLGNLFSPAKRRRGRQEMGNSHESCDSRWNRGLETCTVSPVPFDRRCVRSAFASWFIRFERSDFPGSVRRGSRGGTAWCFPS